METNQQENQEKDIVFGDIVTSTDLFGNPIEDVVEEEKKEEPKLETKKEEPKAEEKKEEVKKEEKSSDLLFNLEAKEEKKEKEESNDEVDWNAAYQTLVATGQWDEVEIEGEDKTIDEATFKELAKQQKERSKNKLLDVLSKDEKDFLEYKKNGGDVPAFLKYYGFQKQAEDIDISTDNGKKQAVYAYYKNFVGWSDEKIDKYIKQIEKNLELDEEAVTAKDKIEEITKQQYEQIKENARKQAEVRLKAENDFKDTVKTNLKGQNIETKKINSILRDFTERDDKGYTEIDKKYLELRNNPEKVAELWMFLMDYENFEKKVSQKKVNESELETFKKIVFNKKSKTNQPVKVESEENELII